MSDKLKLWDLETSTDHLSSKKTTKCHSDLSSSIWSLFILISFPLHMAWTWVRISDRRVSLMSSNWPRRPALKNIFERRHRVEDQQVQQVQFCWFWTPDSHLCVSKLVLVMVDIQRTQKFLNGLSAVHKRILRNSKRIQNAISGRKKEEKDQMSDEILTQFRRDSVFTHLCLKSAYRMRFGKPFLQILIPSRTPLHLSWWRTKKGSITPGRQPRRVFIEIIID